MSLTLPILRLTVDLEMREGRIREPFIVLSVIEALTLTETLVQDASLRFYAVNYNNNV